MGLKFFILVNKQGQTRVAQYYSGHLDAASRAADESEIIRKCLARSERQCSFFEFKGYKLVFRRYASLYFIVGVDPGENELAMLEFIHMVVETLDIYFNGVCELDLLFNVEKVHFILDEMISNGEIVETNKTRALAPVRVIDRVDRLS